MCIWFLLSYKRLFSNHDMTFQFSKRSRVVICGFKIVTPNIKNKSAAPCKKRVIRAVWSGPSCLLTESLDTTECINEEQMLGWVFKCSHYKQMHITYRLSICMRPYVTIFKDDWPRNILIFRAQLFKASLRVILLTILADSIYDILIFFAEKMWVAFAVQRICVSLDENFNDSLTNDIVSFEQLGPEVYLD